MPDPLAHLDAFVADVGNDSRINNAIFLDLHAKAIALLKATTDALAAKNEIGRVDPGVDEKARQAAAQGDPGGYLPTRRIFAEVERQRSLMDDDDGRTAMG